MKRYLIEHEFEKHVKRNTLKCVLMNTPCHLFYRIVKRQRDVLGYKKYYAKWVLRKEVIVDDPFISWL